MADCVEEQLLGYLLGALEDSERELVEAQLKVDPELQQELALQRAKLRPLRLTTFDYEPPEDLAEQVCSFVAQETNAPARPSNARSRRRSPVPQVAVAVASPSGGWSWIDLTVAAAIMAVASLLVFPAINHSRIQARVAMCQNNLRQLGLALTQYSERHDNFFPAVPREGQLAVAGIYAPTLMRDGFLQESRWVVCPSSELANDRRFRVPRLEEIRATRYRIDLDRLRSVMGGSYGYCLGYIEDGVYQNTRNLRRSFFVIMADAPSNELPGFQSQNHGGRGQNVLFEDGHSVFLTTPTPQNLSDPFYVNDTGLMAAGSHRNDAVVGSSDATPIRYIENR